MNEANGVILPLYNKLCQTIFQPVNLYTTACFFPFMEIAKKDDINAVFVS